MQNYFIGVLSNPYKFSDINMTEKLKIPEKDTFIDPLDSTPEPGDLEKEEQLAASAENDCGNLPQRERIIKTIEEDGVKEKIEEVPNLCELFEN